MIQSKKKSFDNYRKLARSRSMSKTSTQAGGNCETETEGEVNSDSQELQDFISEQKSSNTVK